jgi:hypothetical protein
MKYPFPTPPGDYLWRAGDVVSLDQLRASPLTRYPVLAIGSNASPEQLCRKFKEPKWHEQGSRDADIPVWVVTAHDVDVVYGAHIVSTYKAIPATLMKKRGASVTARLLGLTLAQLCKMTDTEIPAYGLVDDVATVEYAGCPVTAVRCFVLRRGVALLGGSPVGLAATEGSGQVAERGDQAEAWRRLAEDMGRDTWEELFAFVRDKGGRNAVMAHLKEHRAPSDWR